MPVLLGDVLQVALPRVIENLVDSLAVLSVHGKLDFDGVAHVVDHGHWDAQFVRVRVQILVVV